MQIFKNEYKLVVAGIICDCCNKRCTIGPDPCDDEYATLQATWGFDSKQDGTISECHFCEDCFEKIENFIKSIGGKIRTTNYIRGTEKQEGIDFIVE